MNHIDFLQKLALEVYNAGGELWLIGGAVREMLFQQQHPSTFIHPSKDLDCEVYGIRPEVFEAIITQLGDVNFIGKQFGVYHLDTYDGISCDFNFPRADSVGRRPEVAVDIHMSKYDACRRRNFTVNSAMYNPLDGEIIDHFGAERDIKRRCLHPVSLTTFPDDPLRPLIGMFLAGAYDMWPSLETEHISRRMMTEYDGLPSSRIWGEWWKWATRSIKPSKGLNYLITTQWLRHYPELAVLDSVPQDPEWHPEGNVMVHTWLACDEAAIITKNWEEEERGIVVLAALCHDLDKATTTCWGNGYDKWPLDYANLVDRFSDQIEPEVIAAVDDRIRRGIFRLISPGHDAGIEAEKFLNRIFCPDEIKEQVLALVKTHMAHVNGMKPRKLRNRLGAASPKMWLAVVMADHSARPPLPQETPFEATKLYHEMKQEPEEAIVPLVTGKHLLALGHKGGPPMGLILKNIFELGQLEGRFDDLEGGIRWAWKQGWINNPFAGENIRPDVLEAKRNK